MARYFQGREVELLAPAGTFDIFDTVIRANCDAVYFGGPGLNMRMMRKGYNFSREEIVEAVNVAHGLGKKAYVTVNNMLSETDVSEAGEYLSFLDRAGVDAIIAQDLAVPSLLREQGLSLPVHASVMLNVHNAEMVRALQEYGVTRVVTSREMDLQTARIIQEQTGIEIEYFVHGDMCTVHGANCYISSHLFGMSSNRGKCLKPCRWDYRMKKDGYVFSTPYPLAAKDMNMYEYLPELIDARVTSFKIEGRMRDKAFMSALVNSYGEAIDRYLDDPVGFDRGVDSAELHKNRKRDFSTAYAFGKPGLSNINQRYEGTGKFYSTGKVFSTPTAERETNETAVGAVREWLRDTAAEKAAAGTKTDAKTAPKLTVRVNNMAQAKAALEAGVDELFLSGDVLLPDRPFGRKEIAELAPLKGDTRVVLATPRMMNEIHFEQYDALLSGGVPGLDALLVTNIGAVRRFKKFGLPMIGDLSLNLYNHMAESMYRELGVERLTASIEANLPDLAALLSRTKGELELTVHGTPVVMYMEHDLYENTEVYEPIAEESNRYVRDDVLVLVTDKGESPVYKDVHGRCHLTTAKEICMLPVIGELAAAGISHFRIEGSTYSPERLTELLSVYRTALGAPERAGELAAELEPAFAGFTLGALAFRRADRSTPANLPTTLDAAPSAEEASEKRSAAEREPVLQDMKG
ncbi:peptidase U32 family protein [Saccharibacillus alkalitolerans]|uniref:U32 family peptidase n=1 Tax=Saccharibacillus alkalitolerans TaxID=2705290 RepID=A0ABX0FBR3_9BACL|nr:U32 family peptidase [Saccharibacillus alkalitolerans]NGZ77394.1 U32 family peptidase [Saccharibacillus alkalitolerans]